jgi:DNA-binding response OmpR family regulator
MQFPKIAVLNHSGKYLANVQRRLKTEPYDVYLFYQSSSELEALEELSPDLILLGRRHGFPKTDADFLIDFKLRSGLRQTPIVLALLNTMRPPEISDLKVSAVWLEADYLHLEPLIALVRSILMPVRRH